MTDKLKIKGNVLIRIEGPRGIKTFRQENLIVNNGKNILRDLLKNGTGSALTRVALGSGTNAASATDTALQTQTFAKNITQIVAAAQKLTVKLYVSTSEVSGTFNEAGLFAGATLFSRLVLATPIVKASDETLYLEWEITF